MIGLIDPRDGCANLYGLTIWDEKFQFRRVHVISDIGCTHCRIRANGANFYYAFPASKPALSSSRTSLQLSQTYMPSLTASLGLQERLLSRRFCKGPRYQRTHDPLLDNSEDNDEFIVMRQYIFVNPTDIYAGPIKTLLVSDFSLKTFNARDLIHEMVLYETSLFRGLVLSGRKSD